MFDHTDMDPRELPLSTLGMVFVFLPLIIASLYFRVLEKMVKEDVKKKEDKTSAIDVTSYDSLVTLVNDLAEFGLILAYCFACEHYPPYEHAQKVHNFDVFLGSFFLLILSAFAFTRNVEAQKASSEISVMNREQTEEWKGWMQFLFLMYHWASVPEAYNLVRVLITAYVWLTGFGNLSFFYIRRDFGLIRVLQMLWRLNFLVVFLCLTMGNPYILYYICPLHTFYFLFVYVTMGIRKDVNHTRRGIRLKLALASVFLYILFDLPGVPLFRATFTSWLSDEPAMCEIGTTTKACPVGGYSTSWEWYFRSSLDHWSTMFGMIFALNMPVFKRWIQVSEWMSPEMQFTIKSITGVLLGCLFAWWLLYVYTLPKLTYNEHHAYFGWIPILFYIYIRNCTGSLRRSHLGLLARMGKITLETYLLQHHIWLTSNAKTVLTIVPHSSFVNFLVVGIIYMYVSHRLYRLTLRLRGMFLPNKDLRRCMIGLCVLSSMILCGIVAALGFRAAGLNNIFVVVLACALVSVFIVFYVLRRRDSARSDGRVVVIGTAITFVLAALAFAIVVINIQRHHNSISISDTLKINRKNGGVLSMLPSGNSGNIDITNPKKNTARHLLSETLAHPQFGILASPLFGAIALGAVLVMLVTMDSFLGLTSFSFGIFDGARTFGGSKAVSWEASYGPLHMWLDGVDQNDDMKKKNRDEGDNTSSKTNGTGGVGNNDDDDDDLGNTTRGKKNKNNKKVKMSDEEEGSDGA